MASTPTIPSPSPVFFLFLLSSFLFFLYVVFRFLKNNPKMVSTTNSTPSSSSTSSSSSSNSKSSYDVFLSFRGEDTRYTFTDHLYRALNRDGIDTFKDEEGLDRGAEIAPELLKAIEGSKFSIVVFSENYAHSKWCLEEVAKIMECKKERNQTVIPIFYHVDPSEQVRNQRGSYGKAFALHEKHADEETMKKIQKWRSALSQAANLAGHHVVKNQYESELIEKIIDLILQSSNSKLMSLEEVIVGMDSRKKDLKSLLDTNGMIGIYGIGGVGKTTIAKIIYNDIISEFDGGSFLQNVREEFEKDHQLQLQQQLLYDIMRKDIKLRTINDGVSTIKGRLHSKKVLIVVDDVDNSNQLELLVGSLEWFGLGSRVIITTRDQQVLSKYRSNASSYEIKGLNYYDASQLFCWHAFEEKDPKENYKDLSKCIIDYAQGLPLALKVLGSFLCDKTIDEWKSAFEELKKNPNKNINNVLRISFEGLDDIEKEVFLDIACFFKGEDKNFVSRILDNCGLYGKIKIRVLFYKCLITISNDYTIGMHDLIQQMGWAIVKAKGPNNPYKGTRLWDPNDIRYAFSRKEGIENIEVISCDLSKIKNIKVNTQIFTKMKKLRLLKVHWSCPRSAWSTLLLPKDFEFSSKELRYLYWKAYPLKILPSNFQGEHLVELNMQNSNMEQLWKGNKILGKLKVVNLSFSNKLIKMSKFWTMPNLERLILEGCTSLRKLDSSIGELKKLTFLGLVECPKLSSLPDSIDELPSLEFLILNGCQNLKKFPGIRGNMRSLRKLDPSGVEYLTSLKMLELTQTAIKELPSSIGCLESLEELDLRGCIKLEKLPEIQRNMGNLSFLYLYETAIKELPSSIGHLTGVKTLNLENCKNLRSLPSSICKLRSLEYLALNGCSNLKTFPEILEEMECLKWLYLSETAIEELPSSIENLRGLQHLDLTNCKNLQKLPHHLRSLQCCLEVLGVSGCKLVEGAIPSDLWSLYSLRSLNVSQNDIRSIPAGIIQLSKLECLSMNYCGMLEEIPELPSSLKRMEARGCPSPCLETLLSNRSTKLSSLEYLDISQSDIRSIPAAIAQLSKLRGFYMNDCKVLEEIIELPSSLRRMDARGCACLESSPSKFWSSHIKCFKSLVEEVECYSNSKKNYYFCKEIHIVLPGNNGIPEWVIHKNTGGEVTIDLPPNWYEDDNLLGFAVFFHFPHDHHGSCELTISGGDQVERVDSFNIDWSRSYPELVVKYVPQIAISGNHRSNKWRKLKAYLSPYYDGKSCEEMICGIHLIYAGRSSSPTE